MGALNAKGRATVEPAPQDGASLTKAGLDPSQTRPLPAPASASDVDAARLRDVLKVASSLREVLRGALGTDSQRESSYEVAVQMFCAAISRMFRAHHVGLFLIKNKSLILMPACKRLVPGMLLRTTKLDDDQIAGLLPAHAPNFCLHRKGNGYIYAMALYSDAEVIGIVELQAAALGDEEMLLLECLIDALHPAVLESFKQTLASRPLSSSAPPRQQQLLEIVGVVRQQLDAQLVRCRSDVAQMSEPLQQLGASLPSTELARLTLPYESLKRHIDNLAASATQLDNDAVVHELQACSSMLEERYDELLREVLQSLAVGGEITLSTLGSVMCPSQSDSDANGCSLLEWHVDFAALDDDDPSLMLVFIRLFHALGLTAAFGITSEALVQFLVQVRALYVNTPFHNWRHSCMVAHKACLVMLKSSLHLYVSKLDFLALLLASIGHDAGHLGRTNSYEVGSESPLAITYNNKSVLENHHCAMLHKVLASCPELLGAMTRNQRAYLRKIIIELILATDMAVHGQVKNNLCALQPQLHLMLSGGKFTEDKTQDNIRSLRSSLLQSVMHGCDLYSPTLPWGSSRVWVGKLGQEFEKQVQLETDNGMPVSSFLTHSTFSELAASEAGFVGYVVRPFWEAVVSCLPEIQTCLQMIESNSKAWREAAEADEAAQSLKEAQQLEQKQIIAAWRSLPCGPDGWAEQAINPEDLQSEKVVRIHRKSIFDGSTTNLCSPTTL